MNAWIIVFQMCKFNCVYLGSLRVDKKIPCADTGKLFELVFKKASAMQDL